MNKKVICTIASVVVLASVNYGMYKTNMNNIQKNNALKIELDNTINSNKGLIIENNELITEKNELLNKQEELKQEIQSNHRKISELEEKSISKKKLLE